MSPSFFGVVNLVRDRIGISGVATLLVAFSMGCLVKGPAALKSITAQSVSASTASSRRMEQFGYCRELSYRRSKPKDTECPYEYLVKIYGKHPFETFVREFRPALKEGDTIKYTMTLKVTNASALTREWPY